jgi:hypothetical protein
MRWFFLIGLALSLLVLYLGSRIGFGAVLVATLFVLMVWGAVRKIKERKECRLVAEEIEETGRLLEHFRKESTVLLNKLRSEESVSPKAAEHYKETYHRVLPLVKKHGWRLDSMRTQQRQEEGDYGDHLGIVEGVEETFKVVRSGIDRQAGLESLGKKALLDLWECEYSLLLEKVNSDEVAPQELKELFEQLSEVSTLLFPRLPDSQVQQLEGRFLDLTEQFKARQSSNQPSSNFGNRNCPECSRYYPVLRLTPDASEETIKNAYKNLAKIYHSDKYVGKSEWQTADDEMKRLNVAYKHIMTHFEYVKA